MRNGYPKPGDRCGFICGPSQSARDNAGMVIAVAGDEFYSQVAYILRDDGRITTKVGTYTNTGIGCYLIAPAKVTA